MADVLIKTLNDSVEIPMIGFGTWQLEGDPCVKAIQMALDIGYRHIDTAHIYNNHEKVKEGIGNFPRKDLFITTKLWRDFHDPKQVESACDQSLKELGLDYVDLYLVHWPEQKKDFAEIVHQIHLLKEKGKVRSVGLCNATISHIQHLIDQKLGVSMNQIEFHPFLLQMDLLKFCKEHNIAVTAYSPLARGEVSSSEVLKEIGQKHQKTPGQVALRWLLQKEAIVIPKSSSEAHIREN